jgi:hypothetical protein
VNITQKTLHEYEVGKSKLVVQESAELVVILVDVVVDLKLEEMQQLFSLVMSHCRVFDNEVGVVALRGAEGEFRAVVVD